MAAVTTEKVYGPQEPRSFNFLFGIVVRLAVLGLVNAVAFWLGYNLWRDGNTALGIVIVVIALGVTVINLWPSLWPL